MPADVHRRSTTTTITSTPSHIAALRRLSLRAASSSSSTTTTPSTPPRSAAAHQSPTALLTHLRSASIPLLPGLSDPIIARIEADLNFTFPPDLRSLLSTSLPFSPLFPHWHLSSSTPPHHHLRRLIRLPLAAVSTQIAKGAIWCKSWGRRPQDEGAAMRVARGKLDRAPVLVPVYDRCYVASSPCLAGNPVFYVDEENVFVCAFDLEEFFRKEFSSSSPRSGGVSVSPDRVTTRRRKSRRNQPRWIEFWSEVAAQDRCKRTSNSSSSSASTSSTYSYSSSSSPDRVLASPAARRKSPKWVEEYINRIGSVLKQGGWYESDVSEIVEVPSAGLFDGEMILVDNQVVLDALLLKADRFSDSLRRAGWSSEDVGDVFGFDFGVSEKKRVVAAAKKLSPEMIVRIEEMVDSVCRKKEKPVAS